MPIFIGMVVGKFYQQVIKFFFDLVIALGMLILLIVPILFLLILMGLNLKRFPIFTQERVGMGEVIFKIYKIRTMKVDEDELSLTRIGKLLRSLSIDEVPQLFNIIKGEMSFVGPRPLLVEYLDFYNEEEKKRHFVKPGLTGWAQVNGRNEIDWGARMRLDTFYVENLSFALDLKIILRTLLLLLKKDPTPFKEDPTIKFSDYASKR